MLVMFSTSNLDLAAHAALEAHVLGWPRSPSCCGAASARRPALRGSVPSVNCAGWRRPRCSATCRYRTRWSQAELSRRRDALVARCRRSRPARCRGSTRCMRVNELQVVLSVGVDGNREPALDRDDRRDRPVAEDRGADAALAPSACPRRTAVRRSARTTILCGTSSRPMRVFGVEVVGVLRFGRVASRRSWPRRTGCPSAGCRCS